MKLKRQTTSRCKDSWKLGYKFGCYSKDNGDSAKYFKQRSNMIIQFAFSKITAMKEEKVRSRKLGDCESNQEKK